MALGPPCGQPPAIRPRTGRRSQCKAGRDVGRYAARGRPSQPIINCRLRYYGCRERGERDRYARRDRCELRVSQRARVE